MIKYGHCHLLAVKLNFLELTYGIVAVAEHCVRLEFVSDRDRIEVFGYDLHELLIGKFGLNDRYTADGIFSKTCIGCDNGGEIGDICLYFSGTQIFFGFIR